VLRTFHVQVKLLILARLSPRCSYTVNQLFPQSAMLIVNAILVLTVVCTIETFVYIFDPISLVLLYFRLHTITQSDLIIISLSQNLLSINSFLSHYLHFIEQCFVYGIELKLC